MTNQSKISKIRYYASHLVDKIQEDTNFQSMVLLLIFLPIFFVYIFVKFERQTAITIIITGIAQGSFYALLAIGFSIIFGVARMFKLSIGGYFVLGAYTALWLRKMTLMNMNAIASQTIENPTMFFNKFILILPVILYFVGILLTVFYFGDKKYGIPIASSNLLMFIIYRGMLVSNFGIINIQASIYTIIIQVSIIYFVLSLKYFELSRNQLTAIFIILNVLMIFGNTFKAISYSPSLYFAIFLISSIVVAVSSMVVDRTIIEKIRSNPTNVIIVTFGIALIIQSIIPLVRFPENREFVRFSIISRDLPGIILKSENANILGTTFQTLRIISTIGSILLILLVLLFTKFTQMGKAMYAVAQDEDAAWLMGINVRKVYMVATGLGMGLTAAAAILSTPFEAKPFWGPYMGWTPLVLAIAVVTLGGMGSIWGSAIAGLIVGFAEALIATENIELSSVVPLIVILVVMLLRPNGLFGRKDEDE